MYTTQYGLPFQVLTGLSHDTLHAYIVTLVLEALLLGTFTVTYTMGAYTLITSLASPRRSRRDWILMGASTTMFGLAVAHHALSIKVTFVIFPANTGGDGLCHSALLLEPTAIFPVWYGRLGIYVSQTLIGDVFMIYRLFLVWNRSRKVIVIPAILCLVNGICGYLTLGPLLHSSSFTLLGFFLLSFISNVLCSVLIIWRVFRSANQSSPLSARLKLYQKVAEAIVQSAAIYSTASVALGLTFFFNPNNKPGFLVCLGVFPPLIGLVFSFIVLRIARSSADDADAARRGSHPGNGAGMDKRRGTIAQSRPMSVPLRIHPFPPPAFDLASLEFAEDPQTTDGSDASTGSVRKQAELLPQSSSTLAGDRDLEGPSGEDDLGMLDVRTSKSSWNI